MTKRKRIAPPMEVAYRWKLRRSRDPDALANLGLDFLEGERMKLLSVRTVQHHDYWLGRFFEWCSERGIASIHDVTRAVLVRFQRTLFYYRKKNGRPLSAASQQAALTTLRAFFRYLTRQSVVHANPAADLDTPRVRRRTPAPPYRSERTVRH